MAPVVCNKQGRREYAPRTFGSRRPAGKAAAIHHVLFIRFAGRSGSMAVQQNKKSPSKRGMHRAHDFLTAPATAVESTTGEVHLRHHISPSGFYRGKKVLKTKGE
jgi:large subunit ribosomal protein L32